MKHAIKYSTSIPFRIAERLQFSDEKNALVNTITMGNKHLQCRYVQISLTEGVQQVIDQSFILSREKETNKHDNIHAELFTLIKNAQKKRD